jgi:hypothetical protein
MGVVLGVLEISSRRVNRVRKRIHAQWIIDMYVTRVVWRIKQIVRKFKDARSL